MQNVRLNMNHIATLDAAAEELRDNIWVIVENWMLRLSKQEGEHSWSRIPETQLIDSLPTLLRGVSKVVGDPMRLVDFDQDGVIHNAATEFGKNRRLYDYRVSEVFYEQELLRDIIWEFCRKNLTAPDFYELEQRINRPLDKLISTIAESYTSMFAMELKYLARRDKLTDFLNYDAFKEAIGDELRRSRRYRHSFSLLMLDIDGFKDYNGKFGSTEGDLLIRATARIISQVIRGVDIPVRYGADQFAIILPETSKKQASKVAERLRRAIKIETRHSAEVRGDLKATITVSSGISTYPLDAESVDEIISLADEALFEAKKAGKDLVMWK